MTINVQEIPGRIYCIEGAKALDPVSFLLLDYGPGKGGLVVWCFGQAWSAYWGGMGDMNVAKFLKSASVEYIAEKLSDEKGESPYLLRIVAAIKENFPE